MVQFAPLSELNSTLNQISSALLSDAVHCTLIPAPEIVVGPLGTVSCTEGALLLASIESSSPDGPSSWISRAPVTNGNHSSNSREFIAGLREPSLGEVPDETLVGVNAFLASSVPFCALSTSV